MISAQPGERISKDTLETCRINSRATETRTQPPSPKIHKITLLFIIYADDPQDPQVAVSKPVPRRRPRHHRARSRRLKGVDLLSRLRVRHLEAGSLVTASHDEAAVECEA